MRRRGSRCGQRAGPARRPTGWKRLKRRTLATSWRRIFTRTGQFRCGRARAAYFAVLRALAEDALAAGNPETAIRYDLRLLERDRFDEGAHLALVGALSAAGKHGEARGATGSTAPA